MLDDSPFWCRFAYGRARAPTRRCSGRARRRRRIWKDTGINTHRQHVRIVQSHHRILCNNSNCRRSSLLSSSHAASLSLPRRACVTSPAQSLLSVSQIQNLPLSAPARSVCPANPLPTSSSSSPGFCPCHSPSLAYLLAFLFFQPPLPLYLSLSLSPRLPLSLFFPSPTRSFAFPLPPAFCFAAVPLPAHLFCLFSGPPPLLLSHPDSLTPPPSYFSASVTPANFPLPSAFLSCRSPPLLSSPLLTLSLSFYSLSPCRWVNWGCWHHWERAIDVFSSLSLSLSDTHLVTQMSR